MNGPRRLIEVDLPIARISANAAAEKQSRRGHVPLMYIWPATKPPSACRAVLLAALVLDPADPECPPQFRNEIARLVARWAASHAYKVSRESSVRLRAIGASGREPTPEEMRAVLLDFVADYSNPQVSSDAAFAEMARGLVDASHGSNALSIGPMPTVLDTFAGGGAIPLEALRLGCVAIAGELNPVAVLYEKVLLSYLPRYGAALVTAVDEIVSRATVRVKTVLSDYYPSEPDGSTPIAYLWARTILSDEPTQLPPVEVPFLTSMWLARGRTPTALRWQRDETGHIICDEVEIEQANSRRILVRRPRLEVFEPRSPDEVGPPTGKAGSATCPVSGFVTAAASVRQQLRSRRGGARDARLYCVVTAGRNRSGRSYRLPEESDWDSCNSAVEALSRSSDQSKVPNELLPDTAPGFVGPPTYGAARFADLFAPRQLLFMTTFVQLLREEVQGLQGEQAFKEAVATASALVVNRLADLNTAFCGWQLSTANAAHMFVRWAYPMMWGFAEVNPLAGAGGSPQSVKSRVLAGMREVVSAGLQPAEVIAADARALPLADDSVDVLVTDPPYYNTVPYGDLSDFFYVWMHRTLEGFHSDLLSTDLVPKQSELVEMRGWDQVRFPLKDKAFFESGMERAFDEGRRTLRPDGIAVIVFAHKSTAGWEALLGGVISAGWTITASWPIDTEMTSRLRARASATLASSVHLVCRPRESSDGSITNEVGDWREVLAELGPRIQAWMPRLAQEGIVGADAIFACIGPALEIFSRYSRVERTSGQAVSLAEYLEHVWAAVARAALAEVFVDADSSSLEEDARLTAMWLWTNRAPSGSGSVGSPEEELPTPAHGGYSLEFDAARKIAQGLGAHLEDLPTLLEIKGEVARLYGIRERAGWLFQSGIDVPSERHPKREQLSLFPSATDASAEPAVEIRELRQGSTVLDRLHQAMILFGAGRSDALHAFLDGGPGSETRFWSLAQSLSALYPSNTDEKRWVDGVLARKKGFGH